MTIVSSLPARPVAVDAAPRPDAAAAAEGFAAVLADVIGQVPEQPSLLPEETTDTGAPAPAEPEAAAPVAGGPAAAVLPVVPQAAQAPQAAQVPQATAAAVPALVPAQPVPVPEEQAAPTPAAGPVAAGPATSDVPDGPAPHREGAPAPVPPTAVPAGTSPDRPAAQQVTENLAAAAEPADEPAAPAAAPPAEAETLEDPDRPLLPGDQRSAPPAPAARGDVPSAAVGPSPVTPMTAAPDVPAAPPPAPAPAAPVAAQLLPALGPALEGPDGAYSMSLQLYPEELGAVQMEVVVRGSEISLALHAADEAALEVLRAALPELRAQLESSGLTAAGVSVDHGRGGRHDQPAQQNRPGPATGSGAPAADAPAPPSPDPDAVLDVRM